MGWEAWLTICVLAAMVLAMARNVTGPDLIMLGGLTLLMSVGMFTDQLPAPAQAVQGFGNSGLITVAVLFVIAAAMTNTGAMQLLATPLLGRPKGTFSAQLRLMPPITAMSAFLNNTPIVAMFMPVVSDWAKKAGLAPSRLLIPLSYAAIFGGICTLIGTSTNLIVSSLIAGDDKFHYQLGFFEIGAVGLPCALVGIAYMLLLGRKLLPDRRPVFGEDEDPRQYTVEMVVEPDGPLVGQTVEQAALRSLPGLYLIEIDRNGELIPAPGPDQYLRANDRLIFAGVVESVVDLRKMRGLSPATNQVFKLDSPASQRTLIEAVVSNSCPLLGQTIREGRFRSRYNAAVIAVARDGQRVRGKIGDIVLQPGDTLLLEAHPGFVNQKRNSRDFFLVSRIPGSAPPRHEKAPVALGILAAMVLAVTLTPISMLNGALLAAGLMWLTRCCTGAGAREAVDWQVLVVIGAALGLGQAVDQSGLADAVASGMLASIHYLDALVASPWNFVPLLALLGIYLMTNLFTELITNNAAAVLIYPIAKATALTLDVNVVPFVIAIMIAASASFSTPIGYQTNLMVYGPGGYRYSDYLRIGLPLNLLIMAVTVALAPWIWPF
jgi:di/tricarboxylate transporter